MYRSQYYRLQDCTISFCPRAANELLVKMDLLDLFKGFSCRSVTVATHKSLNGSPQPGVEKEGADWAVEKKIHNSKKRNRENVTVGFQIWWQTVWASCQAVLKRYQWECFYRQNQSAAGSLCPFIQPALKYWNFFFYIKGCRKLPKLNFTVFTSFLLWECGICATQQVETHWI